MGQLTRIDNGWSSLCDSSPHSSALAALFSVSTCSITQQIFIEHMCPALETQQGESRQGPTRSLCSGGEDRRKKLAKEQRNRIICCKVDSKTLCSGLNQQVGQVQLPPLFPGIGTLRTGGHRPQTWEVAEGAGLGGRDWGRPPCHRERRRQWLRNPLHN